MSARNDNRDQSNTIKDPEEWTTGDEPMTGTQQSFTDEGRGIEADR